jgi:hypothetical protein
MIDVREEKLLAKHAAKLKQLFGPPPVLSSEDPGRFDQLLADLMACFTPADFLEQTLIWELAVLTWEMARGTRHKTLAIERKFCQHLEFQVKRSKALAEAKASNAGGLAEANRAPLNDLQRLHNIQDNMESLVQDVDKILDRAPTEREHAFALERTIDYYERLDDRLGIATRRRNAVLEQFEMYRTGLGQQMREAANKIIEVEYREVKEQETQVVAPPVAPSGEGTP